jgi:predicted nucleotide-binding protein
VWMKKAVERFLIETGIRPITLEGLPYESLTTIEKVLNVCRDLDCGVVLLSPDDECYKKIRKKAGADSPKQEIRKMRARQNVIWELGYCFGLFGRGRTIIIYKEHEKFEWPSNLDGIGHVPFKDPDWRQKFKEELKVRGYEVKNDNLSHTYR